MNGKVRRVLELGEPLLREPAKLVAASEFGTPELQELVADLIATMRDRNGAGIAATQIGVDKRVFVVQVKDNPRYPYKPPVPLTVFINPKVEPATEDKVSVIEGCLSVPGVRGRLIRPAAVNITAQDVDGKPFRVYAEGLTACSLQHENEHLDGVLFVDSVRSISDLMTWEGFERAHKTTFFEEAYAINAKYPRNIEIYRD